MTKSSLWAIDQTYKGKQIAEFDDSFIFSPIVWEVLFQTHLPEKTTRNGQPVVYMYARSIDSSIPSQLTNKINNHTNINDRIMWSLSLEQIYKTKYKQVIADSIRSFLYEHKDITGDYHPYIQERFDEVAKQIESLDESVHPHFVFKNTSIDDSVEYWFEGENGTLKDVDHHVASVISITSAENNEMQFIDNVSYFNEQKGSE